MEDTLATLIAACLVGLFLCFIIGSITTFPKETKDSFQKEEEFNYFCQLQGGTRVGTKCFRGFDEIKIQTKQQGK